MGIDAVAVLRIPGLAPPVGTVGWPLADGTLRSTLARFDRAAPDEHALALRQPLGPTLDAHDDPRGILFFPDVCEPRARDYAGVVAEVAAAGVWAPTVPLDHVPWRYARASAGSHEALVHALIGALGRDRAVALDAEAQVWRQLGDARPDAASALARCLAEVRAALGDAFAATYEASLARRAAAPPPPPLAPLLPIDLATLITDDGAAGAIADALPRELLEGAIRELEQLGGSDADPLVALLRKARGAGDR